MNYLSCILNLKTILGSFVAEHFMVLFALFAQKHSQQYFGVRMSPKVPWKHWKGGKVGHFSQVIELTVRKQNLLWENSQPPACGGV